MEHESVLERRLNGDEDPKDLPLALLKHITNGFSEDRKIAQGGFSAVYKAVLRNGAIVAVKTIDVNIYTIDGERFRRELDVLMFTNHENIIRLLGFCSNTHQTWIKEVGTGKNYLVNVNERILCLEYISNGSLDRHITDELRGLPWETRFKIITGICNGLCYLHTEKIIHMDLQPANILLDDHMVPKITDFGSSRPYENSCNVGECFGTLGYISPEYEKGGITSFKCDIYSLGVIIIELVTGCMDFPDKDKVVRRWRHRWGKPPTLLQIQQVTRCIEIAVRCRQQEPKDRPSIGDIISFLRKSESTNEHTGQISPCFDEDDMLGIKPLELLLPYQLKEEISCFTVEITNDTRSCFAFNTNILYNEYITQPDKGIVQPESKRGLKITVQPQGFHEHGHVEKFIVQSMKVSKGLRDEDITKCMFEDASKVVDEVSLMVVYESVNPQENCKSREDTNMLAEEVPKKNELLDTQLNMFQVEVARQKTDAEAYSDQLQMKLEASNGHGVLELMLLDENAGPTPLPFSLLDDITNHFSHVHEIGRGGFAVVYEGMVGKVRVAVKKLTRTHDLPESKFHKEVECLVKAKHKNIVRCLGYCVETQGKAADYDGKFVISDLRNWLLCFEYLPNGSLEKYITDASTGLEWTARFRIIQGICEGLHYLHLNCILHLDLKPANILLDGNMVPKIADFGLSKCLDEKKTHATTTIHMSGTPGYMAPEILYGGKITFASDIYSLGGIIMEMLTGVKGYPEDENVIESWMHRLQTGNQLEQVRVCTKIAIECMEMDPKKRPVAWRIVDMLDKTASADETAISSSLVGL